jgi:hypothetical protein
MNRMQRALRVAVCSLTQKSLDVYFICASFCGSREVKIDLSPLAGTLCTVQPHCLVKERRMKREKTNASCRPAARIKEATTYRGKATE